MRLHTPLPFFLLAVLFGLSPILRVFFPQDFFPAVPSVWMGIGAFPLFALSGYLAFARLGKIYRRRDRAQNLIQNAIQSRSFSTSPSDNDLAIADRTISRLAGHADVDLSEINPEFSLNSLLRLEPCLGALLEEIETPEDALIRLGVVGAYLGETACRFSKWTWYFKSDPGLKQFGFLCSIIKNQKGDELDPYAWAADLLVGRKKVNAWIGLIQ